MGSVIGNALAQGVYVSEQNRRNAIDPDDVDKKGSLQTDQLVVTARGQAQNLSTNFNKLQAVIFYLTKTNTRFRGFLKIVTMFGQYVIMSGQCAWPGLQLNYFLHSSSSHNRMGTNSSHL